MKSNWQIKKLNEVCVIRPAKNEVKKKLKGSDVVSFLPMSDLGEYQKDVHAIQHRTLSKVYGRYTYFADNDVLLAKITPCFENGKLGIVKNLENGVGFGSSEYVVFRTSEAIIPEYLFYFLSNPTFRNRGRKRMNGAVGHKRVAKSFIENYKIPLPSINEQKRIVKILDEAFEKLEIAKKNTEKNLANTNELFESYSSTLYNKLLQSVNAIPLKEVATLVRGPFGGSLTKSMFVDNGYAVYEQRNAINRINDNFRYFIDEKKYQEMKRFAVSKGDMLMSCSGTIGKFTILKDEPIKGIINQALLKITANNELIDVEFLLFVLSNFIKNGSKLSKGAAIKNIVAVKELKKIKIPLISITKQNQLVIQLNELLKNTEELKNKYQDKLYSLEELKKSLLQKAFSGEL